MRWITAAVTVLACACAPNEPSESSPAAPPSSTVAAPVVAAPAAANEPAPTPVTIDRGDGLKVEVELAGTGPEIVAGSAITLHYRAFVAGTEQPFDSTYAAGVPLELTLGASSKPRVIEGLARGLLGLREGTKAKLDVPAALGWGSAGNTSAGVPADAALVWEVHVVDVR